MTALAYYVIGVHLLAALFFAFRALAKWAREEAPQAYRITTLTVYMAATPALMASQHLRIIRLNLGLALLVAQALLGTLLLLFIYDAHFRRPPP